MAFANLSGKCIAFILIRFSFRREVGYSSQNSSFFVFVKRSRALRYSCIIYTRASMLYY